MRCPILLWLVFCATKARANEEKIIREFSSAWDAFDRELPRELRSAYVEHARRLCSIEALSHLTQENRQELQEHYETISEHSTRLVTLLQNRLHLNSEQANRLRDRSFIAYVASQAQWLEDVGSSAPNLRQALSESPLFFHFFEVR